MAGFVDVASSSLGYACCLQWGSVLVEMFSGLPYTIVAVVNFDGAVAKRCVEKLGLLMQYFWVATTGPSFTDKTGLWQHSFSLTVRKSDTKQKQQNFSTE